MCKCSNFHCYVFVLTSSLFPLKCPNLHDVIQVSQLALYILHIFLLAAQIQHLRVA